LPGPNSQLTRIKSQVFNPLDLADVIVIPSAPSFVEFHIPSDLSQISIAGCDSILHEDRMEKWSQRVDFSAMIERYMSWNLICTAFSVRSLICHVDVDKLESSPDFEMGFFLSIELSQVRICSVAVISRTLVDQIHSQIVIEGWHFNSPQSGQSVILWVETS
jgi:hypothetical protein